MSHLVKLLKGVRAWNSWRQAYPKVKPDLRKALLNNARLSGINFDDTDLRDANLYGADLINASLRRADLRGAKVWGVDFTNADLTAANLMNIAVLNQKGRITNFSNATLLGVALTSEADDNDLTGFLELSGAKGLESARFDDGSVLEDYLARAFAFAHYEDIPIRKLYPRDFEDALKKRVKPRQFEELIAEIL